MIISPFTPLFFDDFKSDGIESRYIQVFATTDHILLECLCAPGEPSPDFVVSGTTEDGDSQYSQLSLNSWTLADRSVLWFTIISGLAPGIYQVLCPASGLTSHFFRVTDDSGELAKTTLIQYSMKDNAQRQDAVFIIDGMRYFFDFRVPGGFKDSGWTFAVDNEQFITPEADPVELFGLESTQKKFTMGGQEGVPVYFAEMLNRLLTCSYVYFDGVRYARKDSSVPEMNVQIEGLDSFIFTQLLQRINNLNPVIENSNHMIMRRIDDTLYRITANTYNRIIK
jgi:hypothetical protein